MRTSRATGIASAGAIAAVLLSGVPAVRAEPQIATAAPQAPAKGDPLLVVAKGTACSERGWPHFETTCQFDLRRPAGEIRPVRVIGLR